jgi:hypothetical protein
VLFEVVRSLFTTFAARDEVPVSLRKKRLTRQVRPVFAGLGTAKGTE